MMVWNLNYSWYETNSLLGARKEIESGVEYVLQLIRGKVLVNRREKNEILFGLK